MHISINGKRRTVLLWKTKTHWAVRLCALERWTDSRCLKLDCVRDRKKVTSSVNEKQKACGISLTFSVTSSVFLHRIGWNYFVISQQFKFVPRGFFFPSSSLCLRVFLFVSPSILLSARFAHPHWFKLNGRLWAVMLLETLKSSFEGFPHLGSSWCPSGVILFKNKKIKSPARAQALRSLWLSAQLLCPCRVQKEITEETRGIRTIVFSDRTLSSAN